MDVRTRPTAYAGVLAAFLAGSLPTALVGLDVAWVVIASGAAALVASTYLARRQVRAIDGAELPSRITLHAGRTLVVPLRLTAARGAQQILVHASRTDASPAAEERAPRLAIDAASPTQKCSAALELPIRITRRGRADALALCTESTYPFGLSRSVGRTVVPTELFVLPRVLGRGDHALEKTLARIGGADDDSLTRWARRGAGLPASFRPSCADDSARDIAWRASARKLRWISVDRTLTTQDRVTVVLLTAVRGARASSVRRARLAFEAAVTTAATAVDRLTRAGHEVIVQRSSTSPDAPPGALAEAGSTPLSRSVRPLPHLLELAELEMKTETTGPGEPNEPLARHAGHRVVIVATVGANVAELVPAAASADVLFVDPNGRTRLAGMRRSTARLPR
ncbi:MAG: DUF58 domain-containing protein [Planctomycetota bacterium]